MSSEIALGSGRFVHGRTGKKYSLTRPSFLGEFDSYLIRLERTSDVHLEKNVTHSNAARLPERRVPANGPPAAMMAAHPARTCIAGNLEGLPSSREEVATEQQPLASASAALSLTRLDDGIGNAALVQVLDVQRLRNLAELKLVQTRARRI